MAPEAKRISGPSAIRYLLTASEAYQSVVRDTVSVIQEAIDEGMLIERETEYAKLLMSLAAVERDLGWTLERSRILLGEATEEEG
jgi:hypothetical protein